MKMRADIHHGNFDPSQPKRKGSAPTFADIAEMYITDNESGWRWPRAGQSWRNSLHVHASALSRMPVNTITAGHVKEAIHKVWLAKPQTAKKVRGRIQRVLDMARVQGHRDGPNPATWQGGLSHMLPKLSTDGAKHLVAIPVGEIPGLATRLVELDSLSSKALLFTLLCAVRTGDTIGAKWAEIDLPGKAWNIPKGRTKSKRPFRVPLTDAAASLLAVLPRNGEHVFARATEKPLSNMAMLQCLRGIKGMGATVHGTVRSCFKDWCSENNHPDQLSEMALDHLVGDATRNAYARSDLWLARQELMAAWSEFVMVPPAPELALSLGSVWNY